MPIVLAWGTPSLVLWLWLRAATKRSNISADRVRGWLIIGVAILLGLYVVSSAMEKDLVSGPAGMNLWGFMWVLTWWQQRLKLNDRVVLNLTGHETVRFQPQAKAR
jgi:hypothetical protein